MKWVKWLEYLPFLPLLQWGRLPRPISLPAFRILAALAYATIPYARRVTRRNLEICGLAATTRPWNVYQGLAAFLDEVLKARFGHLDILRVVTEVTGYRKEWVQHLSVGAIFCSGHIGNFLLPLAWIAAQHPERRVLALYRPLDNPLWDREFRIAMERLGLVPYSRRMSPREMIQELRRGSFLGMLVDNHAPGRGCFVPFFGQPAPVPRGLSRLQAWAKVPVFFGADVPGRGYRHSLVFEGPLPMGPRDGDNLAGVFRLIEKRLRVKPSRYFWMQPMFKRRPPGVASVYPGIRL